MVNSVNDFDLAPIGVLRAAAWPMETLGEFGDRSLAKLAQCALVSSTDWARYIEAYQKTLDFERKHLWQKTVDDPRFMKALILSNPLVAKRSALFQSHRQKRTKTVRRLENTLYRYLARAAGRTTPGGLWAGVTPVTHGSQTLVQNKSPQFVFTPDLRPFQSILKILGKRSPYWEQTIWHINPTIALQPNGSWQWWAKTVTGQTERRVLPTGGADALVSTLMQLSKGTFANFTEILSQRFRLSNTSGIRAALEQLALGGMLLGGLDLPTCFTTSWEALTLAEQVLSNPERQIWRQTVDALQGHCDLLASHLEQYSPEKVVEILQEASQSVAALISALEIEPLQLPDPILHCDYGLPFQVEIGPKEQLSLQQTLATYEKQWLQGWSPASALRLEQSQQQNDRDGLEISKIESFWQSPLPQPMNWANLCTGYPSISTSVKVWNNLLKISQPEITLSQEVPVLPLPLAPWGCLYVQLQTRGWHQVVQGVSDHVTQAFARFGPLVDTNNLFRDWCQHQLTDFATRYHLIIAEIQEPLEQNPNVLARPSWNLPSISLWTQKGDRKSFSLQGGVLRHDPLTQLPLLHLPNCKDAIAVFGFASAHIAAGDPIVEHLLQTGFQSNPNAIFRAISLPTPAELEYPHVTPRVVLSKGQTLRPRRTVLSGSQWVELINAPSEKRFVLWQQLACAQGWPTVLSVEVANQAPLLVFRDSPMSLSALFKGLQPETPFAIVEAADAIPWLVDAQGYHYQSELAQPFRRNNHGWSPRSTVPISPSRLNPEDLPCLN